MTRPCIDARAPLGIGIARLKRQSWMSGCKMHHVFATSARDLEHMSEVRQFRTQRIQDGVAIARGRGSVTASIMGHDRFIGFFKAGVTSEVRAAPVGRR